MEEWTVYLGVGGALIVVAIVEGIKRFFALTDDKWNRIMVGLSILVGILWNALVASTQSPMPPWNVIVILGLFAGLTASGLYSGGKAVLGK